MKVSIIISSAVVGLIYSRYVEFAFASSELVVRGGAGGGSRGAGGGKRGDYVSNMNGGSSSFYRHPTTIPKSNSITDDNSIPKSNSNNSNSNSNKYLKRHYSKGNVKIANGEDQSVDNVALSYMKPNSDQVEVMDLATVMKNSNRRQQQQQGRRKRRKIQNTNNNQPKLLENGRQHDDTIVDTIDSTDDNNNNRRENNNDNNSFLNKRSTTQMLKSAFRHMNASLLTIVMVSSFVVLVKLTLSLSASNDSVATLIEEAVIMRRSLRMMSSNNNAFANISNIEQFVKSRIGGTFQKSRLLFTKKNCHCIICLHDIIILCRICIM